MLILIELPYKYYMRQLLAFSVLERGKCRHKHVDQSDEEHYFLLQK